MVTLTFTGTPSEIYNEMAELLILKKQTATAPSKTEEILAANGISEQYGRDPHKEAAVEDLKTLNTQPPAAEKKRTRRTKAEMAAAKNPEETFDTKQVDESPAALEPTPSKINKQTVHEALQQVNVAVGLPKAREILTFFKVNRMSELQPDQFAAFIAKCNEATMMA